MNDWRPIETIPPGKYVLLWFIGNNAPLIAHQWMGGWLTIDHQFIWDGQMVRPLAWFSHWKDGPEPPPPQKERGSEKVGLRMVEYRTVKALREVLKWR